MNGQPGVATHYSPFQHYVTNARLTPLFVAMTQDDPLYPAATVLPHVQALFEVGASARVVSYPTGGHTPSYAEDQMTAFRSFLRSTKREALPDRLRFSASDAAVGAVRWIAIEELGVSSLDRELSAEPDVLSRPGRVVLGFGIERDADAKGVGVGQVRPASPAAAMGLVQGDRIVAMNGIEVADTESLRAVLGETPWGTTVRVRVERADAAEPVELTTELPPFTPESLYPRARATALVEVRKTGNTVALASSGVRKLRLLLAPQHFDLGQDVVVTVDGVEVARARAAASVERLLTGFAREADAARLFAAELLVELPAPEKR
jgi:membrane-associated protease RseP (regulator of RpoE activity)